MDEKKEKLAEAAAAKSEEEFNTLSGISQGGQEVICPATVYMVSGGQVRGKELNSMVYSQMGVFIVGETGNPKANREVNRVIPWERVDYIEYNFELLEELLQKNPILGA